MQYLAGGRPCVVSELPGLDEVVKHGVNGMIIPSADVPAAADAVAALLSDPEMLSRLARGARETDLSNWAATTMCTRIANVYEALAGDQEFRPVRQQRSAVS
jgi:glycosyltransferase involved in cell wall biosynthesis